MSDENPAPNFSIKDGRFRLPTGIDVEIPRLIVPDKGLLIVVGPNGGGKTSLATYLCGLRREQPSVVHELPAMCWQHAELVPGTVLDNLELVRHSSKFALGSNSEIEAVLRYVDLTTSQRKSAATLSGGEAQRLSIARTLMTSRFGMILDEPSSSLDYLGIEQLVTALDVYLQHRQPLATSGWIAELNVDRRFVICITHDRMLIERLAPLNPRFVAIDQNTARGGKSITVDTNGGLGYPLSEIRARPPSLFWAEFFDAKNIFYTEAIGKIEALFQLRRRKTGTRGFVIIDDDKVLVRLTQENSTYVQGKVREIDQTDGDKPCTNLLVEFSNDAMEPMSIWSCVPGKAEAWVKPNADIWVGIEEPTSSRSHVAEGHR
ncbi:ATP-binding cassette domain-containing protein [Sphingomonas sp.]|uniref:ATP-binding cassette domain-containing protein n=1 Tax=Sphingomonas sp. TaxID=28214 RepID=UPI001B04689D|nr:ATP-binding cassette domain-containing protein [Sphingomonas sp.]MBO9712491.1 ATP-binding cassette domain-containing protein [Sphingomonas sp.]